MTAKQIAAQINRNVSDMEAGFLTWDEFGEAQIRAWDQVAQGEMNIIGSACDRRHMAVKRELNKLS